MFARLQTYTDEFLVTRNNSRTTIPNAEKTPTRGYLDHRIILTFVLRPRLVALNYQTADSSMFYNIAKFAQNGNCGYVLKPRILRDDLDKFDFDDPSAGLCRTVTIKASISRSSLEWEKIE